MRQIVVVMHILKDVNARDTNDSTLFCVILSIFSLPSPTIKVVSQVKPPTIAIIGTRALGMTIVARILWSIIKNKKMERADRNIANLCGRYCSLLSQHTASTEYRKYT